MPGTMLGTLGVYRTCGSELSVYGDWSCPAHVFRELGSFLFLQRGHLFTGIGFQIWVSLLTQLSEIEKMPSPPHPNLLPRCYDLACFNNGEIRKTCND